MSMGIEIFISAKTLDKHGKPTRDAELARQVHNYLTSQGHTVFLSSLSLAKLGVDAYKKAIDDALDEARILIAIGTRTENLNSQWVRYEWDSFFNDILSGNNPDGHVFVYVEGINPAQLPRSLRQRQVFSHGPNGLKELGNFVRNALGEGGCTPDLPEQPEPFKIQPGILGGRTVIGVVAACSSQLHFLKLAIDKANSGQSVFRYVFIEDAFADAVRVATFRKIYAPDFFNIIEEARLLSQRNHPFVIVVTDSSVSDNQLANRFGANRAAKGLAVVTTNQVPETIVPSACMAAYFIYYLGRYTLSFLFPDIRNHSEPRSCVFDHKIRKSDMVQSMIAGAICDECRQQLLSSGGLGSATSILALDRLFALSGDILKQPIGAAEIGVKDKQ